MSPRNASGYANRPRDGLRQDTSSEQTTTVLLPVTERAWGSRGPPRLVARRMARGVAWRWSGGSGGRPEFVADSDRAALQHFGAKPTPMEQTLDEPFHSIEPFERGAGLTEFDPTESGVADGELTIDEVIQRDPAGADVATARPGPEGEIIFAPEGFEGFGFDEGHLSMGFDRVSSLGAGLLNEAVAVESEPGDGVGLVDGMDRTLDLGGEMDGFHVRHSGILPDARGSGSREDVRE